MNGGAQPLVTVVTPVYNAEKYLAECIESVLAQTYENWEYVVVNNCSTDRSLGIARHYGQQDARVRVHDNSKFLNQMQNWNHAMRQLRPESKYCKVVHADDWLFPECLTQMVALAQTYPSVGIVSAYRLDETSVNLDGLSYPSPCTAGRELGRRAFLGGLRVFGSPTSLLLRADLVRKRPKFYDESTVSADTQVCFDLLRESDFGFVHRVLTYTRRHNESLTSLTRTFDIRRVGRLAALIKYGPDFLRVGEYQMRVEHALDSYHGFLARKVFEFREKAFWDYHRSELERLGCRLDPLKVARAALLEILDFRKTLGRVGEALSRRGQGTGSGDSALRAISSRDGGGASVN